MSVTGGAKIRKGVLIVTWTMLLVQIVTLAATAVFYVYATSKHRDFLSFHVSKIFYDKADRMAYRRGHALEVLKGL